MLPDFGVEEERFRLQWVSAAEGPRFAEVVRSFTEQLQKLGPSPYGGPERFVAHWEKQAE
jgi:F420-non-reducing hydrogenase iron-sulfur subunit